MPEPIKVELAAHSPAWAQMAEKEAERVQQVLGENVVAVYHIGSTAIAGIHAKPIVDLMPVVRSVAGLDDAATLLEGLGYQCWGEFGIAGRRYCTLDDQATGRRQVQLHCYEVDHREIRPHLAFRDYLRAHPAIAREYDAEKHRCRELHPDNSHLYTDAKAAWIAAHLEAALAYYDSTAASR
jgi:GrpB-like predicted nucleotidyltransferase (UPF0157 family)